MKREYNKPFLERVSYKELNSRLEIAGNNCGYVDRRFHSV